MTKLGVLDIGTNSIHLVLAEVEPDFSYKILDRFKDMTRLGDGSFSQRRLSPAAMTRALEVIRTLATLARNKGYERIEAVATSAVREASNGGEFIEEVARQTGITVRVVTGQEEARLIFLGVRNSMDLSSGTTLVIDVGGGSVELMVGKKNTMIQSQSLKLGAIRLKDLHLRKDPPSRGMVRDMQRAIEAQIDEAFGRFRIKQFDRVVASSGMAANLTDVIYQRRTGRPVPQLNLARIGLKEIRAVEELLTDSSFKERLAIPGLDPKRADTLLPATAVIRRVMERVDAAELTISDKAIREGILYDFIERNREGLRAEQEIPNVRRRNVIGLARRCHYPEAHSHHVAKLALQLFDQTRTLHGLGDREREWLEYAALLHDIGYVINQRQHHKHAYYLIKHSDLAGLSAEEVEMVAQIARYHRRALPENSHAAFKVLTRVSRRTLGMLGGLLRMADALDRTHFLVVQAVSVKVGKSVTIRLRTSGDAEMETWAARGRADLFEQAFNRSVEFAVAVAGEGARA
jgi:exopolyphosphatase/guanosine-5'-triphosphate,3'-diphosphate pyrophosphatase